MPRYDQKSPTRIRKDVFVLEIDREDVYLLGNKSDSRSTVTSGIPEINIA